MNSYEEILELGPYLTFQPSKNLPIYNWFYYKEAFSPQFIDWVIKNFYEEGIILDPFCGVGTTNLFCKLNEIDSIGIDINPISILASKVKCNYDIYDLNKMKDLIEKIERKLYEKKEVKEKWYFELFPPERAFPKGYSKDIIAIKEIIDEIDEEIYKNFFTLALISIIPYSSTVVKDGGVLKINKTKSVVPPKIIFLRKIKKMLKDLENLEIRKESKKKECICRILEGDARNMSNIREIKEYKDSIKLIVTSPPYLNNVDYTKVYGLELSLILSEKEVKELRKKMFRSFLEREIKGNLELKYPKLPLVANCYFEDLERFINQCDKILKEGKILVVVGNSIIREKEIEVDKILCEIASKFFDVKIVVGAIRKTRIENKIFKARESIVILKR
ncbi:MAG: DNA adenine methylase [Candidatus Micrarchaeia archaeon]